MAIDALADGIARQKLADPDAVPDDLMGRVLSLLFAGVTRPAQAPGMPASEAAAPQGPPRTSTRSGR